MIAYKAVMPTRDSVWTDSFPRVPNDPWVSAPIEELAQKYDSVEQHGWYKNLDPTVGQLVETIKPGDFVVDYSGGTGILLQRLLRVLPDVEAEFAVVDASPKFLRLALDKFSGDCRVGYRWLRYLKDERRLETLKEALTSQGAPHRGVDILCSTNAIHLYTDLEATLSSWNICLKPNAHVFIQSGNIRNPHAPIDTFVIDDTVEMIQEQAKRHILNNPKYASFRDVLADNDTLMRYSELRQKIFVPIRSLEFYDAALHAAGFKNIISVCKSIEASIADWSEFLNTYHDAVLGWAGGVEKITRQPIHQETVKLRKCLLQESLESLFLNQTHFSANWTYISAVK